MNVKKDNTHSDYQFVTDPMERMGGDLHIKSFSSADDGAIPAGKVAEYLQERKERERIDAYQKCFPLGSVVRMNDGRAVMIVQAERIGDTACYLGCNHPEGVSDFSKLLKFTHSEIDGWYHMGYINSAMRHKCGLE